MCRMDRTDIPTLPQATLPRTIFLRIFHSTHLDISCSVVRDGDEDIARGYVDISAKPHYRDNNSATTPPRIFEIDFKETKLKN